MDQVIASTVEEGAAAPGRQNSYIKWQTAAYIKHQVLQIERKSSHLVDPRSSKLVRVWDVVMGVALIFTALFTPFEIGFDGFGGCRTNIITHAHWRCAKFTATDGIKPKTHPSRGE